MGKEFFITGCGTGIGKTVITCSMIRHFRENNQKVSAIKPVASGWDGDVFDNDVLQILEAFGLQYSHENIERISPWRFTAPLAPTMAARKEGRLINYSEILDFCNKARNASDNFLVEGAGGLMTPLTESKTNLDLIVDLKIPAILVTGTYLGSISHTLTAIKAIESAGATLHSIVVNESGKGISIADTISELKAFTKYPVHGLKRITAHDGFVWQQTGDHLFQSI